MNEVGRNANEDDGNDGHNNIDFSVGTKAVCPCQLAGQLEGMSVKRVFIMGGL